MKYLFYQSPPLFTTLLILSHFTHSKTRLLPLFKSSYQSLLVRLLYCTSFHLTPSLKKLSTRCCVPFWDSVLTPTTQAPSRFPVPQTSFDPPLMSLYFSLSLRPGPDRPVPFLFFRNSWSDRCLRFSHLSEDSSPTKGTSCLHCSFCLKDSPLI